MDINNIYMVRSAKGVDMLCVDDYLYHYDGRGRGNTYRWLCNRRKDKHTPCRSRISTVLANPRDKTVHIVQEVGSEHSHPRCSDHEITKVSERKRLANLQGQPCTLELRRKKRSAPLPKSVRMQARKGMPPSKIARLSDSSQTESREPTILSSRLDFMDRERVHVLRRLDGRIMCCVDGQLYYLDGRSSKMDLYRWICVRKRDVSCTSIIYTEPTIEGTHRLRPVESDAHIHPHYSPGKLTHMFEKHSITVVDDEQVEEMLDETDIVTFDTKAVMMDVSGNTVEDEEESIIIEEYGDDYEVIVDEVENPTEVTVQSVSKKWPRNYDLVNHYVPPPGYDELTDTDISKFSFLPSAKGKQVLCVNRQLYNYDSQSKTNMLMYWTCVMRHAKGVNCHVRVTMDPTENGPVITRITGQHNHKPKLDEIEKCLKRQEVLSSEFYDPEGETESDGGTTIESTAEFDNSSEHLQQQLSTKELRKRPTKKVIGVDGIKLEPEEEELISTKDNKDIKEKPSIIVEYLNDGSAKIEILPEALKTENSALKVKTISPKQQIKEESETSARKGSHRLPETTTTTKSTDTNVESDMDLTKICKLRSAKGSEMLCVDGYIYHAKNKGLISRSYWVCIKARDPELNCKSRLSTATQKDGSIRVLRVYNRHTHPINEDDIKRRLFNEINKKCNKKLKFRPLHFIEKSLEQINAEYGDLAIERLKVSDISQDVVVHKPTRVSGAHLSSSDEMQDNDALQQQEDHQQYEQESESGVEQSIIEDQLIEGHEMEEVYDPTEAMIHEDEDSIIEEVSEVVEYDDIEPIYSMKLYAVSDGPPSLAVRMTLRALNIEYQLINVDFCALEHRTDEFAKMNPQKEIPVLDDDGFFLSESVAIMQYLCDKYAPNSTLYPHEVNLRALINQRLCFNMAFYYAPISAHSMAPIFFDYERTPMSEKKVLNALDVFETYLQRTGTKYAAGNELTIADFGLVAATICLEAIEFDLSAYPHITQWYNTFKEEYPFLWEIANTGMQEIAEFEKNPPDLSHVDHPFHPTRKSTT